MTTTRGQSTAGLDAGRVSLVRGLAAVTGLLFLLIGIAGFFVTGFDDAAANTDERLGFELNPRRTPARPRCSASRPCTIRCGCSAPRGPGSA
jgi:hypothetical protein